MKLSKGFRKSSSPVAAEAPGPASTDERAVVLLVDDEEAILGALSDQLRRTYRIISSCKPLEAIELLRNREVAAIISDQRMPGVTGAELLAEAARSQPDAARILLTGFADLGAVIDAVNKGQVYFYLSKPWRPAELEAVVSRGVERWRLVRHNEGLVEELRVANADLEKRVLDRTRELQARNSELAESKLQLEVRNTFIRQVFGRYLSEDVVTSLLETSGLELSGEKRTVTILMSDLRGFTALSERLAPEQVVSLLNIYLGAMTEVIVAHGGTIDEFLGDAILVIFGAPLRSDDHAERAVACGLEMLARMEAVNASNRTAGLPEVEMGIGVHTGEVVVGSIGSVKRAKYGVVGSAVNLASRIESFTFGGQLLISEATRAAIPVALTIVGEMSVEPKGVPHPVTLYDVVGIDGANARRLAGREIAADTVEVALPIRFLIVEGKDTGGTPIAGTVVSLSRDGATLTAERFLRPLTNLKISILGTDVRPAIEGVYAKTLLATPSPETKTAIRFTSVPPEASALFADLRRRA